MRENAANSLNVQITTGIVLLVSIPLDARAGGLPDLRSVALVVAFVLHLIGALKAHRGEWWRPPTVILPLVH